VKKSWLEIPWCRQFCQKLSAKVRENNGGKFRENNMESYPQEPLAAVFEGYKNFVKTSI
jgi:hypothetical protein